MGAAELNKHRFGARNGMLDNTKKVMFQQEVPILYTDLIQL